MRFGDRLSGGILLAMALLGTGVMFFMLAGSWLDDSYIGFTYLQNLYRGNGLVFTDGIRVEGLTNTGWILFLAPFGWAAGIPAAAKAVSFILFLLALILVFQVTRGCNPERGILSGAAAVALTAFSFDAVFFSFSGMETPLLAVLLVLTLHLVLREKVLLPSFLLGLSFAVRPETVLIAPVWLGLRFCFVKEERRGTLKGFIAFIAVLLLLEGARLAYYGELLPNTFRAKPTVMADLLERMRALPFNLGGITNITRPFSSPIIIILEITGLVYIFRRRSRSASLLGAAILFTALAFCIYARPDWTGLGRYYAPYLPVSAILAVTGIIHILHLLPLRERLRTAAILLFSGVMVLTGSWEMLERLKAAEEGDYPWFVMTSETLRPPAEWISRNIPEGSCIASMRIGCLAYYSDMEVFDWKYGLTDASVADLVSGRGEAFAAPDDPELEGVWMARLPDYILEDDDLVAGMIRDPDNERVEVHGALYEPIRRFPVADSLSWVLLERVTGR